MLDIEDLKTRHSSSPASKSEGKSDKEEKVPEMCLSVSGLCSYNNRLPPLQ